MKINFKSQVEACFTVHETSHFCLEKTQGNMKLNELGRQNFRKKSRIPGNKWSWPCLYSDLRQAYKRKHLTDLCILHPSHPAVGQNKSKERWSQSTLTWTGKLPITTFFLLMKNDWAFEALGGIHQDKQVCIISSPLILLLFLTHPLQNLSCVTWVRPRQHYPALPVSTTFTLRICQ